MQKLVKHKILLVGDDEGPKSISVQNLFRTPAKPLTSTISFDIHSLHSRNREYQFWCVDSHQFDNDRETPVYFKDCDIVFLVPKDHADLIKMTHYLIARMPGIMFTVLVPSDNTIEPSDSYDDLPLRFIVTHLAKRMDNPPTEAEVIQFIEEVMENEHSIEESRSFVC